MPDQLEKPKNDNPPSTSEHPGRKVRLADLSLLFVALLWGAGFIAVQFAITSGMSTPLILALRFAIGAAVVFAFKFKTIMRITKKELLVGLVAGAILFFSFFMQTLGQMQTGVSNSAFITAIYVVIVPFIIWIVKRKPPKLKMFILVFTTLIGVLVLTYSKGTALLSFSSGDIYLLLCALGFAAHIVYLGVAAKDYNPTRITFIQLLTSAIFGTILFFSTENPAAISVDWTIALPAILYVGIFSTAVCYFLQTWAQTITTPSKAAIIMSAESLFGPLFAILIGFEVFKINIVIGGFIILASVVLSEIEFKRRRKTL
ncbi:MAG: DMT family transporter [Clostridia bacterium]|jgi:drug/metabolite transporter (DMT)-like permease|nr:DMT family transporter [Clostridia bacterium]